MENQKEEQMIYLKDLIFAALHRWKTVLVVAVIFALLLGGMQGVKGLSALKAPVDPAQQQAAQEAYEEAKASLAQHVQAAQENIEQQQAYLEASLRMQLDPYCHYEAALSLYVKTDYQILPGMSYQAPDKTVDVLKAYEAFLNGGTVAQALADKLATESRFVTELLEVKWVEKTNTLTVSLQLPTQEAAQTVLTVLEEQIAGAGEQIEKNVSAHSAVIAEQSVNTKLDMELAQTQKDAYLLLDELETELEEAQKALAAVAPPAAQTGSLKAVVKKAIIFAVVGGVLGVFLTVAVIWVAHIGTDKVYAARNLSNRTGVKVIATLSCEKKNPVDRMVYRLEGRGVDAPDLVVAATDIRCRAKDVKRLLITGSGDAADRESLVQAVAAAMPGVQVEDKGGILRNADALEALSACDTVVLVEKCGMSGYTDIQKQVKIIDDYGAKLLGCVLMER